MQVQVQVQGQVQVQVRVQVQVQVQGQVQVRVRVQTFESRESSRLNFDAKFISRQYNRATISSTPARRSSQDVHARTHE